MGFDPLAGDPLRADDWDAFIGQENLKERLEKHIAAAVQDRRAPGHVLLVADPGYGKTTLARIVAKQMGVPFETFMMPVTLDDIHTLLIVREFDGVLLLDEIHRASNKQQEELFTLIDSNYIQFRGEKFLAGYLTIVAATTEPKKLIKPLKDRFDFVPDFDPYSVEELAIIVEHMMERLGVPIAQEDALILGKASGGAPRGARRFALAARDLYVLSGRVPTAHEILDHLRIDENGLSVDHWRYLEAIHKVGGQAGLRTMSAFLNENEAVVEELEQLLIKQNLISYSDKGRKLLTSGFHRLREREKEQKQDHDGNEEKEEVVSTEEQ